MVPWKLWSMVGCLVLADAVFLTVWQLVDPLKKSVQQKIIGIIRYHISRKITTFGTELSENEDEDIVYQPQIWVCRSGYYTSVQCLMICDARSDYHNVWLGLTYGYKGLLLILGLFLAYETRSVKVK